MFSISVVLKGKAFNSEQNFIETEPGIDFGVGVSGSVYEWKQ